MKNKPKPSQQHNTTEAIAKCAMEICNDAFQGKSFDLSLKNEDGSVTTIKLEKAELFRFIVDRLIKRYKEAYDL